MPDVKLALLTVLALAVGAASVAGGQTQLERKSPQKNETEETTETTPSLDDSRLPAPTRQQPSAESDLQLQTSGSSPQPTAEFERQTELGRKYNAPPPPVLTSPSIDQQFTTTPDQVLAITFRWRAGDPVTGDDSYRICVYEADKTCATNGAPYGPVRGDVFKFAPNPGLPMRFQDKVLAWTVTACRGSICTDSAPGRFRWALLPYAPQLVSPASDPVTSDYFSRFMVWRYPGETTRTNPYFPVPKRIITYLLCVARPGIRCGTSGSWVVRANEERYYFNKDVAPREFAGLPKVNWTVAACNDVGCTWQQQVRELVIPALPERPVLVAPIDGYQLTGRSRPRLTWQLSNPAATHSVRLCVYGTRCDDAAWNDKDLAGPATVCDMTGTLPSGSKYWFVAACSNFWGCGQTSEHWLIRFPYQKNAPQPEWYCQQ